MKPYALEKLASLTCQLGEGPLWQAEENNLYCVDIEGQSIWRLNPRTGEAQHYPMGFQVSCLALREQGGFMLAGEHGFARWEPVTGELVWIAQIENAPRKSRFNDGGVGPGGRFWAGMMSSEGFENNLYCLDRDLRYHVAETNIGISNGIGWSPDRSTMYFTDSPRICIYAYDFDPVRGAIENRRVWVDSGDLPGVPDGLCIDNEGCVWSARWDGWQVSRYDPEGQLMLDIPLPVQRPTSCAFGGDDMQSLFITSARTGLSDTDLSRQPMAGDIFMIKTDTKGQKPYRFQG